MISARAGDRYEGGRTDADWMCGRKGPCGDGLKSKGR